MNEPTAPPVIAVPAPDRPAIWPSLAAPFVALAGLASGVGALVVVVALRLEPDLTTGDFEKNLERWWEENQAEPYLSIPVLVLSQVVILAVAVLFAALERAPVLPRLGFVRWRASTGTVLLAVVGTLGVQFAANLLASVWIDEPSESLEALTRMFTQPQGLAAVAVGFCMSVLPGLCEESLYRGLTQRGLLRRWSPTAAILLTSALFAAMHGDVQHSLGVLPLGLWFGFVAWRTGSTWPAVLCHLVNNLAAFLFLRALDPDELTELPTEPGPYVVGGIFVLVAALAAWRLARTPVSA